MIGLADVLSSGGLMSTEADFSKTERENLKRSFDGNDDALRSAFDAIVAESLRPLSAGLAAYYAVIGVAHAVLLPRGIVLPMIATAAASVLALFGLYKTLPHRLIPDRRAHVVLVGIAFIVLWNSVLHLYLSSDPVQSTNLMLLVIGAGFFFLSAKWLTTVIAVTIAGWALVCWRAVPSPDWMHFGFGLLTACVLCLLAFVVRCRSLRRLEKLRLQNELQNRQLQHEIAERSQIEQALHKAQLELETRVQQRTAELERSNQMLRTEMSERQRAEEERRKLEVQVQHAQRLESLGVLAGGIAHDFNNLLVGILGNADLALTELPLQSSASQRIEDVKVAAVRAAELTRQMLAYSGKGKFIVEAVNLNELIEEMAHLLQISISKKAVLRFDFEEPLPRIQADPSQVRQVVMNLITNASEAIGEKSGMISIRTDLVRADRRYLSETFMAEKLQVGYYVALEVSDTGRGMEPDIQQKIFDPFFTTKFTGRGLGLAAVLGIVRGHHGTINVCSETGKGTTFKILFPATSEAPPAYEKLAPRTVENWRGQGLLLVVDDEETVRAVAKSMLERAGFSVLVACDGNAGVELFRRHSDQIVAVLLDLTMPRMNGEETFREMRRIRPDVRVVLTSGYAEQDTVHQFAVKGLAGFIQKPFQFDKLLEKVRQIVES
jgi:signal transduction histidine kinase